MNTVSIVLLALIVCAVCFAVFAMIHNRTLSRCAGCDGSCAGCPCASGDGKEKKKHLR